MARAGYEATKRAIDLILGGLALSVALIISVPIVAVIVIKLGRPVFFRQVRTGKHGELFALYKFRTMTDRRDRDGRLLADAERLTRFGRFLRSTSLDELPSLLNIVRGDLSIVGPRPLLPRYLTRYSTEQARRHEVKPGLTGWAQVNGRNALSWNQKFLLDIWYVDHRSTVLDLKIMVMTFWLVLRRDGISAAGNDTMPEFIGDESEDENVPAMIRSHSEWGDQAS